MLNTQQLKFSDCFDNVLKDLKRISKIDSKTENYYQLLLNTTKNIVSYYIDCCLSEYGHDELTTTILDDGYEFRFFINDRLSIVKLQYIKSRNKIKGFFISSTADGKMYTGPESKMLLFKRGPLGTNPTGRRIIKKISVFNNIVINKYIRNQTRRKTGEKGKRLSPIEKQTLAMTRRYKQDNGILDHTDYIVFYEIEAKNIYMKYLGDK